MVHLYGTFVWYILQIFDQADTLTCNLLCFDVMNIYLHVSNRAVSTGSVALG